MKNSNFYFICIFLVCFLFANLQIANAQNYPANFNQFLVANGLSNPTVFSFAPDGRIFVAQQNGQLRVIKNGLLLATPFVSLSVNSSGERGLLGIAFDPNFTSNNYIYLYYTLSSAANNRISRFTANGDVVLAGSEQIILDLDPLSSASNHNGGTMQFGLDGKLYVGIGENANSANAQSLTTYHGKVLRLNTDGTAPADNPFILSVNVKTQRIWSYGLRNPYTLSVQPITGRIFVNDVGQNTWEEVNDATVGGKNFGWPSAEGISSNINFTNPIYTYNHGGGACAITGGVFFNPITTNYPANYIGNYFLLDYCARFIDALTISGNTATKVGFATTIGGAPVNMATGPDGNLYYLSRTNSGLYKIVYANPTPSPIINAQPQSLTAAIGSSASFYVSATGSQALFYQWRKNGTNILNAVSANYSIPNVSLSEAGNYSVVVSYGIGTPSATSNDAVLSVTQPNQLPIATITSPIEGVTFAGGQIFNYSGTGSDPETGNLAASAFTWFIDLHHDTHIHPAMLSTAGSTSGTFTVPISGETSPNVFYRIYLVVSDAEGLKDTVFRDIQPRLTNITINTNPPNLQVVLDGQFFTAPLIVTSVQGILRNVGVLSPQGNLMFSEWSNGGAQFQDISTPTLSTTYTANLVVPNAVTLNPIADSYVQSGTSAATNFGTNVTLINKTTSDNAWKRESFLRFDISQFTFNVGIAKLRLYGALSDLNTASIRVDVKQVPINTWTENSVNWNNRPSELQPVLAFQTLAGINKMYYEWDLTAFIQTQKAAGQTEINLKLINAVNSAARIDFNSREATSYRPELIVSPNPTPNVLVLSPIADSYVFSGQNANNNFGNSSTLITKATTDVLWKRETLIRFDISQLNTVIGLATLRLFGGISDANNASIRVDVKEVPTNTWLENTVTWNNKPNEIEPVLAFQTIIGINKTYYEWDLTSFIQSQKDAGKTFVNLKLINTGNNLSRIDFNSKEALSNRPQLVVTPNTTVAKMAMAEPALLVEISLESFIVCPNPSHNELNVDLNKFQGNVLISIIDIQGRQLIKMEMEADNLIHIPIQSLNAGVYIIYINTNLGLTSRKFLVE